MHLCTGERASCTYNECLLLSVIDISADLLYTALKLSKSMAHIGSFQFNEVLNGRFIDQQKVTPESFPYYATINNNPPNGRMTWIAESYPASFLLKHDQTMGDKAFAIAEAVHYLLHFEKAAELGGDHMRYFVDDVRRY